MGELLRFQPFDEGGVVRVYQHGFLPHWRQAGCTYFVTFRLADSIPQTLMREWHDECQSWLAARRIDIRNGDWQSALTQLSSADRATFGRHFEELLFDYLDRGYGECVLRDGGSRSIVAEALSHFHRQRLDVGDWVVMPNHVHALMTPYPGIELEELLHSVKSYTAKQINKQLNRSGTLWLSESHDHIVRDAEDLLRIQAYIRANPKKAGLKDAEFTLHTAEYQLKSR